MTTTPVPLMHVIKAPSLMTQLLLGHPVRPAEPCATAWENAFRASPHRIARAPVMRAQLRFAWDLADLITFPAERRWVHNPREIARSRFAMVGGKPFNKPICKMSPMMRILARRICVQRKAPQISPSPKVRPAGCPWVCRWNATATGIVLVALRQTIVPAWMTNVNNARA